MAEQVAVWEYADEDACKAGNGGRKYGEFSSVKQLQGAVDAHNDPSMPFLAYFTHTGTRLDDQKAAECYLKGSD